MAKSKGGNKNTSKAKQAGKGATKSKAKAARKALPPPSPADAQLVIQLYDLRREAVMRASRDTLVRWMPRSYADFAAIADPGHEHNAAFRQVSSYFELAYGLARRGAVHPELLTEWCGEGLLLYAKVQPFLAEFREKVSPTAFQNAEWIVANTELGAARFALFQKRFAAQAQK